MKGKISIDNYFLHRTELFFYNQRKRVGGMNGIDWSNDTAVLCSIFVTDVKRLNVLFYSHELKKTSTAHPHIVLQFGCYRMMNDA